MGRRHKICCETLALTSAVSDFNGKSALSSLGEPSAPLSDSPVAWEQIDLTAALWLVAEQ